MPLNKATGDMYSWIDFTISPLGGECPHNCGYCYVNTLKVKPVLNAKYSGVPRLYRKELGVKLGSGKTIFIQNMGDLFAEGVGDDLIIEVLEWLKAWPGNTYLIQTKNPSRAVDALHATGPWPNVILGTTIETDDDHYPEGTSKAPSPEDRAWAMARWSGQKTITIEPIMKFDLEDLLWTIGIANPSWISIGADSCGNNLPEPSAAEVREMIQALQMRYNVHLKKNLKRILPEAF